MTPSDPSRRRRAASRATGPREAEFLFWPLNLRRFQTTYWPNRVWHGRASRERLAAIGDFPEVGSLSNLLRTRGAYLSAISPDYRSDQMQDRGLSPQRAHRLYTRGRTLTIGGLNEAVPRLGELLHSLATRLGLPGSGTLGRHRCIAYASPAGEALACHFDPSANFVLQLQGRKRWRVAPNRTVEAPVDVYSTRLPKTASGRLSTYCPLERMPKAMPAGARTIVLAPGSVLFLPRGYWHETEALGDSLSLNFVLHQPTWADIWAEAVLARLTQHPKWRSLAGDLWADNVEVRRHAVRRLTEVATQWNEDLGALAIDDILTSLLPQRP